MPNKRNKEFVNTTPKFLTNKKQPKPTEIAFYIVKYNQFKQSQLRYLITRPSSLYYHGESIVKHLFQTKKQRITTVKERISLSEGYLETLNNMLKTSTKDIESNNRATKASADDLDYFTKNRQKFESDINNTFQWTIPNSKEIVFFKIVPDPETSIPYGYDLQLRASVIRIRFNYGYIGHEGFDITCDQEVAGGFRTKEVGLQFLQEMEQVKHYVVCSYHYNRLHIKQLPHILYKESFRSYDDVIAFCQIQADPYSGLLKGFEEKKKLSIKELGETTKELMNQKRRLKALENDQSIEAWFALIIGDQHKIHFLDLINIFRPDRLLIAWFLLIIKSIGVVIAVVYYVIVNLINSIRNLISKN
ncbi:MAG: hypothetical protein ACRCXZ_03345 [Patescibacteria group bacterium]